MQALSRIARAAAITTFVLSLPAAASAQLKLLISQNDADAANYAIGPTPLFMSNFSGLLNTTFSGQVFYNSVLTDFNQLMSHDRLILNARRNSLLSPVELTNLQTFINSGRRVLLFGENRIWKAWDTQLLGIFGAALGANDCFDGPAQAVGSGPLVQGVASIWLDCAHEISGGTAQFDRNYAALFGPAQNALVMLELNVVDNFHETFHDNRQFRQNVVDWLAYSPVAPPPGSVAPEPASLALIGTGLFALAVVRIGRRRRGASVRIGAGPRAPGEEPERVTG